VTSFETGRVAAVQATPVILDADAITVFREDPEELTVYKSMGHAIEDVVAAALVYTAALQDGVGVSFDL